MKIGVIRGQKQSDKRKSAGVSTLLCANWLKNCVCKVTFLLSSYSVLDHPILIKFRQLLVNIGIKELQMVYLTSTVINSNGNMKELERKTTCKKLMFR